MKTTREVAGQMGVTAETLLRYLNRHKHLYPTKRMGNLFVWSENDIKKLVLHRKRPQFCGGRPPYKTSE